MKTTLLTVVKYLIVIFAILFFVGPTAWMLLASVKTNVEIMNLNIFTVPTFEHYRTVLGTPLLGRYLVNSFLITIPALLVGLLLGVPVAYIISRSNLSFISPIVLIVRMAPGISLIIPWYLTFRYIGLLGTHFAISISHVLITAPMLGWLLVSFFDKIPVSLEEAAIIDGCSRYTALARIVLPLAGPGVFSSLLLAFTWSWNNFLFALIIGNTNTYNIPLFALRFKEEFGIDFGGLFASSVIIALPAIIIAIIFQEKILEGIAGGALKG